MLLTGAVPSERTSAAIKRGHSRVGARKDPKLHLLLPFRLRWVLALTGPSRKPGGRSSADVAHRSPSARTYKGEFVLRRAAQFVGLAL